VTSNEIAVRQTAAPLASQRDVVDGWKDVIRDIVTLSETIHATDFVPKGLRGNVAATAAAILAGREIGIGPMTSLQHMYVVEGRPTMSAKLMRARVLAAGHELVYEETTLTRCRVKGRRSGTTSWTTVEWTLDDAKRAGLTGKKVWQNYPRRMLQARATGELCDLLFPDVVAGLPVTEEAEDDAGDYTAAVDEAAEQSAPKRRTAQRRTRAAEASPGPAGAPDEAQATVRPVSPAEARTAPRAEVPPPPLPGEPGYDAPSGEPEPPADPPQDDPGDTPTPASRAQLGKIHSLFRDIGWTDRADRLRASSVIVGRDLSTANELGLMEASALIDTLARVADTDDPSANLADLLAETRMRREQDEIEAESDDVIEPEIVEDGNQ
jgi:hypothetical protein